MTLPPSWTGNEESQIYYARLRGMILACLEDKGPMHLGSIKARLGKIDKHAPMYMESVLRGMLTDGIVRRSYPPNGFYLGVEHYEIV